MRIVGVLEAGLGRQRRLSVGNEVRDPGVDGLAGDRVHPGGEGECLLDHGLDGILEVFKIVRNNYWFTSV